MDRRTLPLRIVLSLSIVGAMFAAGVMHRSPWIVLVATPAFTLFYAFGKWNAWKAAWAQGGAGQIAAAILLTLPIQAIVAGVFYLLGLGVGKIVSSGVPLAALSSEDLIAVAALTAIAAALSVAIIRIEGKPPPPVARPCFPEAPDDGTTGDAEPDAEPELDIDPTPLTAETFYTSPGYWRANAARDALEGRGQKIIEKKPRAASEAMIEDTERRLGVRLPETLRGLYRVLDGGYVGALYLPLTENPRPLYADWRGAFSIDYSSLAPLEALRTVKTHYEDWTDDPDDFPQHADKRIVLQARYGDMTLLDYSQGPDARVVVLDYDKQGDLADVAFEDFDSFFAALRRERPWRPVGGYGAGRDLGPPLGDFPEAERAARFWGEADPHPFHVNATHREDESFVPKLQADDALVAETEARLGVRLPEALAALWRRKNGGAVSHRWLPAPPGPDGRPADIETMRRPVPLEYVVRLAELSDRIAFPPDEAPWRRRRAGAERLLVLEGGDDGAALLLDYCEGGEPATLVVKNLDEDELSAARRFETFADFVSQLRCARRGFDDVAKPFAG